MRFRTLLISTVFVCAAGATTAAAQQEEPQIAKNLPTVSSQPVDTKKDLDQTSAGYSPLNLNRVGVQTAQPVSLSLSEAVKRALENNNDIEVSRDDVRFQETQIRSLLGIYDPVFTATPTFTRNSTTGSSATNDFRVNTNFSKFLERGGGDYQVFFNNTRTENAFAQAQVTSGSVTSGTSAIYSSQLGVIYTQPLLRNFQIDNTRRQVTIARRRLEQTDSDFMLRATDIITQAQRAYWDLVFALRNQQNQVANVNLARENLRQVEARIEAGAAAPLSRAEVATELANREGELLAATQQVAVAENTLKQLILRDPLSADWAVNFVPTDAPSFTLTPVSLEAAIADAMNNRFELRRLKLQKEINEVDINYFKNQTKPQIDLNTSFSLGGLSRSGLNTAFETPLLTSAQDLLLFNSLNATRTALGLGPIVNPTLSIPPAPGFLFGGFNQSLANIFRSDAPNFSVGVTISFPLRNRTAEANLEGARIQQHQLEAQERAQEQAVLVEVRNAVQAVETSRQRVLTARRARENAEIQLEGERRLLDAGRSTTFLLFQRENALTNARNAEIRAETDYNKAIADLQRATSTSLTANDIVIVPPVAIPPR